MHPSYVEQRFLITKVINEYILKIRVTDVKKKRCKIQKIIWKKDACTIFYFSKFSE